MSEPAAILPDRNDRESHRRVLITAAILVVGTWLAYFNSLRVPLILDDRLAITENPSIANLGALSRVLWAPPDVPTAGRPLLNLSFALNHAISGREVFSYHVVNVVIHCLAALALLGVIRRTLLHQRDALPIAAGVAALWAWHPLQTAAITYLSQRAESLMGLCYFVTLYAFVRGAQAVRAGRWLVVSAVACWAGMAAKEVMVTAPVLVLLYDRVFVSPSLAAAWRLRRGYYAALAASWIFLGVLMTASHIGARSVGFDQGVNPLSYALGETRVVVKYLALCFWPSPLVFDYGFDVLKVPLAHVIPCVLALAAALAAIAVAARRSPRLAFVMAAFFLVLAPTSSMVPVALQPMAESRLYVPLAGAVAVGVCGAYALGGRRALVATWAVAAGAAVLTVRRNADYRSEHSIWNDTVAKVPFSARAQNSLAYVVAQIPGRSADAIAGYEKAARLRPDYGEAHYNLATELAKDPARTDEAIQSFERSIAVQPHYAKAHNGLANLLVRVGRVEDGVRHYERALQLRPDYAEAHYNLATVLAGLAGGATLAMEHYEVALKLKPDYAEAHNNLANELAKVPERRAEALPHYEEALRLKPDFPEAHNNFATLLGGLPGRTDDALRHLETAVRLKPDFVEAHYNLANQLERLPGRLPDAIARYETILRLSPKAAETHNALAGALYKSGRVGEAIAHLETALQIKPDYEDARENLKALQALPR
ncbi:MAG TPA: tetratricopeptide repeat protein [Opitutaceae bacterium]|nr:tetratricopeptide repeat protein [Opitutaceae bacterium]